MRSQLFHRRPTLIAFLICASTVIFAQSPGSISGKVVLPDGGAITHEIRISLETLRGVKSSVFTDSQGGFVFRNLAPGLYQIVVEADKSLWETTTANTEVFPGSPSILTITLKRRKSESVKAKGGDTVTATELAASIPPKAQKEFDQASEANREGKREEAIAHLHKAIEYYPSYLMAHNDLGALLLEQGKLDEAERELRTAIAIDSKAFNPQLNLGIVLIAQKSFPEAEEILRKAVSSDPNAPGARFYLGQALESSGEFAPATREFNIAYNLGGVAFAESLFHLGNIYSRLGDREKALASFQKYVAEAPKGSYVNQARKKIQELQ